MKISNYHCRICQGDDRADQITAIEMMFGMKDRFECDVCARCSSIQISDIPTREALAKYYPTTYYTDIGQTTDCGLRQKIVRRDLDHLGFPSLYGTIANRIRPWSGDPMLPILKIIGSMRVKATDKILDVGCGATATLLRRMHVCGFASLAGCDIFIADETTTDFGFPIHRKELAEIDDSFDLIMFHHSFEHVPHPRHTLAAARSRLKAGGRCLIRIPTPSCEAFSHYGTDWVQFDAPRHLSLISRDGMQMMATEAGFTVNNIIDDSGRFQFTGSELYRRGIPLVNQSPAESFSEKQLKEYDLMAKNLNKANKGDQTAFVLEAVD